MATVGLIGRKLGQTRVYDDAGAVVAESSQTIINAATKVETPLIVLFCFFTTTMNKPLKYDEIAGKVDNLGLSR